MLECPCVSHAPGETCSVISCVAGCLCSFLPGEFHWQLPRTCDGSLLAQARSPKKALSLMLWYVVTDTGSTGRKEAG